MFLAVRLLISEIIGFIEASGYLKGMASNHKMERPVIPEEEYPDKKIVHIYICDDNDRPEMAETLALDKVHANGLASNDIQSLYKQRDRSEFIYELSQKLINKTKDKGSISELLYGIDSVTSVNIVMQNDEMR